MRLRTFFAALALASVLLGLSPAADAATETVAVAQGRQVDAQGSAGALAIQYQMHRGG